MENGYCRDAAFCFIQKWPIADERLAVFDQQAIALAEAPTRSATLDSLTLKENTHGRGCRSTGNRTKAENAALKRGQRGCRSK
jgi:hypothetical protein